MNTQNNLFGKFSTPVGIILVIMISLAFGYWIGKDTFNEDLVRKYSASFDEAVIGECDGNGCYISTPEFDTFYASCDKNHFCTWEGKTSLDKQNDIEREKEWNELIEQAHLKYKNNGIE